jgi:hypothetical protein
MKKTTPEEDKAAVMAEVAKVLGNQAPIYNSDEILASAILQGQMVAAYYRQLVRDGVFTDAQALELTIEWLRLVITNNKGGK